MSFQMESDIDLAERRMQRLEHRFRRAQNALAGARRSACLGGCNRL